MRTIISIAILLVLVQVPIAAIVTVNGQPLNQLIQPDQALIYSVSQESNITLRVQKDTLQIGSIATNPLQISDIVDVYIMMNNRKDALSRTISKHALSNFSKNHMYAFSVYMASDIEILLHTPEVIDIVDGILKAPEIFLIADTLKFSKCYMRTKKLQIEPNTPDSIFQAIIVMFDEHQELPGYVQGQINFRTDTINDLILLGARQVHMLFKPEAFL